MGFGETILIAGGSEDAVVSQVLSGLGWAKDISELRVFRAGNFFKIFKLARAADSVLALSPVGSGYAGYLAAKLYKKNFIIKIDDDYAWLSAIQNERTFLLVKDFQNFHKTGEMASMHRRQTNLCARARFVIVPSKFMAEIVDGWGVAKEKIKIIPDPIDFSDIKITKEEARKKIRIPGNLILSVGSLVSWKGFRMLVKIMPQLVRINQFFRLVVVGEGPEYKILQSMIKNLGFENKIYLVGPKNKEDLSYFMAAADMFVLNSGHEAFPYDTVQAMSFGVPVITTASGANSEIIRQGENGFVIKYNDEFNLVEAVKTVWQTPELRNRFIEEGKKVVARFSRDKPIKSGVKIIFS